MGWTPPTDPLTATGRYILVARRTQVPDYLPAVPLKAANTVGRGSDTECLFVSTLACSGRWPHPIPCTPNVAQADALLPEPLWTGPTTGEQDRAAADDVAGMAGNNTECRESRCSEETKLHGREQIWHLKIRGGYTDTQSVHQPTRAFPAVPNSPRGRSEGSIGPPLRSCGGPPRSPRPGCQPAPRSEGKASAGSEGSSLPRKAE